MLAVGLAQQAEDIGGGLAQVAGRAQAPADVADVGPEAKQNLPGLAASASIRTGASGA